MITLTHGLHRKEAAQVRVGLADTRRAGTELQHRDHDKQTTIAIQNRAVRQFSSPKRNKHHAGSTKIDLDLRCQIRS